MRSPLDGLQTPAPVDLRRLPRDLHSVAKQASFETLYFRVPDRFWRGFERFWEAEMEIKINFWQVFCDALAECVLESIFW